jgi:hypothetical protein
MGNGYLSTANALTDKVWNDAKDKTVSEELLEYLADVKGQRVDPQPDQFYFNVAGRSGQIVFDETGTPRLVSKQNLKVTYVKRDVRGLRDVIKKWTIVTEDGTRYVFGRHYDGARRDEGLRSRKKTLGVGKMGVGLRTPATRTASGCQPGTLSLFSPRREKRQSGFPTQEDMTQWKYDLNQSRSCKSSRGLACACRPRAR